MYQCTQVPKYTLLRTYVDTIDSDDIAAKAYLWCTSDIFQLEVWFYFMPCPLGWCSFWNSDGAGGRNWMSLESMMQNYPYQTKIENHRSRNHKAILCWWHDFIHFHWRFQIWEESSRQIDVCHLAAEVSSDELNRLNVMKKTCRRFEEGGWCAHQPPAWCSCTNLSVLSEHDPSVSSAVWLLENRRKQNKCII